MSDVIETGRAVGKSIKNNNEMIKILELCRKALVAVNKGETEKLKELKRNIYQGLDKIDEKFLKEQYKCIESDDYKNIIEKVKEDGDVPSSLKSKLSNLIGGGGFLGLF